MSIDKIHTTHNKSQNWIYTINGENNPIIGELEYTDNIVVLLYVDNEWRNKRIGTDLLDRFTNRIKHDNIYDTIEINRGYNDSNFYENRGFLKKGDNWFRDFYYGVGYSTTHYKILRSDIFNRVGNPFLV